jgi:hypothetical protein
MFEAAPGNPSQIAQRKVPPGRLATPWPKPTEFRPRYSLGHLVRRKLTDYLAVLLLICLSGNPVLSAGGHREVILLASAYGLTLILLQRQCWVITHRDLLVFLVFLSILLMQALSFSFLPIKTILGFLTRLYIGYAVVCLVGGFPATYVNVMCLLAVMSFCFYVPDNLLGLIGVEFRSLFAPLMRLSGVNNMFHILFHNFTPSQGHLPYRNAGIFWEPGAFAGYLLLAMVFLGLDNKAFPSKGYKIRLAVLGLCVLSSMSTMASVVFPLALLLHFRSDRFRLTPTSGKALLALTAMVVVALTAYGAWHLKFLGVKLASQYQRVLERRGTWQVTRFGSLLFDGEYILKRPLLGWGLHSQTRYMFHPGTELRWGQGNGVSDFLAKFGFVGFATFLLCVGMGLRAFPDASPGRAVLGVLILVLILNGETFLDHPLFLGLMFLPVAPLRVVTAPAVGLCRQLVQVNLGGGRQEVSA